MTKTARGSKGKAWVTIVTNVRRSEPPFECTAGRLTPSQHLYISGALVLKSALERLNSAYPLILLVTPLEGDPRAPRISQEARAFLASIGCVIREVGYLFAAGKAYSGPDVRFADTWTKLRALELYEYEVRGTDLHHASGSPALPKQRVILLDSDMLPRRNMDELFDLDLPTGWIAASHACTCNPRKIASYPSSWFDLLLPSAWRSLIALRRIPENCGFTYAKPSVPGSSDLCAPLQPSSVSGPTLHSLNSGLVVLDPDPSTFQAILHELNTNPEVPNLRFPDQDLLARHFRGRVRFLGYEYNALKSLRSCHKPLWKDQDVRNVHFIFSDKPWSARPNPADEYNTLVEWWWEEFGKVEERLSGREGWDIVAANVASKV